MNSDNFPTTTSNVCLIVVALLREELQKKVTSNSRASAYSISLSSRHRLTSCGSSTGINLVTSSEETLLKSVASLVVLVRIALVDLRMYQSYRIDLEDPMNKIKRTLV